MAVGKFLMYAVMACVIAFPAAAGPYTDALGACLADNTTGKDRKDLAKWIFIAMSAHPEIKGLATASTQDSEQINQAIGALLTRLLTQSCVDQARAAKQKEGGEAFKAAFTSLGQLAMQEIMSNQQVQASISGFQKYVDAKKLQAALDAK